MSTLTDYRLPTNQRAFDLAKIWEVTRFDPPIKNGGGSELLTGHWCCSNGSVMKSVRAFSTGNLKSNS